MPQVNNPKRLRHPVREFLLDRTGRRDLANIGNAFPNLASLGSLMQPTMAELQPSHQQYITDVSIDYMAASLESSALLCCLMDICQPTTMVDLGSGYSSYAVRQHAASTANPVAIYSVDDSAEWLGKTREYLQENQCDTSHLYSWDQREDLDSLRFDLIFHDMGDMSLREAALPWVFDHLADGGVVVLDDMHKPRYRQAAQRYMKANGVATWSLRELTFDTLGRFAVMASKPNQG